MKTATLVVLLLVLTAALPDVEAKQAAAKNKANRINRVNRRASVRREQAPYQYYDDSYQQRQQPVSVQFPQQQLQPVPVQFPQQQFPQQQFPFPQQPRFPIVYPQQQQQLPGYPGQFGYPRPYGYVTGG